MSQASDRPDRRVEDLRTQAAEWLLRVQDADVSASDLLAWEHWLKADPLHRQAFEEAAQVTAVVVQHRETLADIPLPSEEALIGDDYDGRVPISPRSAAETGSPAASRDTRRRGVYALAASVLALLGAGAVLLNLGPLQRDGQDSLMQVATAEAEHRSVDLVDGSHIDVGAASALLINYSAERRTVVLELGEALFEVAKDPERPFVVVAGNGTITAVGTAFNVRRDADRVVVTVTEGEVAVTHQTPPVRPDVSGSGEVSPPRQVEEHLVVGERAAYDSRGVRRLANVEPATVADWREGRLRYRAEPLKYVIPDVDRYSDRTLIIGDAAVGEHVFTGTVFQDNADEWLESLQQVFPIEVVPLDGNRVLLRSRQEDVTDE